MVDSIENYMTLEEQRRWEQRKSKKKDSHEKAEVPSGFRQRKQQRIRAAEAAREEKDREK